jgi:phage tail-like protein
MPLADAANRSYAAAHFGLELGDQGTNDVGLFRSIEGGGIRTDVMMYQKGGDYDRWRQLGKPKFEDLKLQVGMSMSYPFYDWIKKFFTGDAERMNGAIVAADFYYKERARRQFSEAMIKEISFPKLDGQDKNPAYMTIGVSVEDIKFVKGSGATLPAVTGFDQQKLWTACNFNFTMDGFADACRRVTKIDSFTVKQNIIEHHVGGRRSAIKTPSQIDFPNVVFYLPEADAQPFFDEFTKRGITGEPAPGRTGSLTTFDNSRNQLFMLQFYGANICNVQPDKSDSSTEEIKQVKVELYTERMDFQYAATAGPILV